MADQQEQTEQNSSQASSQAHEQQAEQPQFSEQERETPLEQIRELKMRISTLEKEVAQEREKATDYMNRAMRTQADISNARKRMQQEMAHTLKDAVKSVVYDQLSVLDSFDRAFSSLPKEFEHFTWVEGMGLIQNQLYTILFRAGVTPIESQGKNFNPLEHEAVAYDETSNQPEDTITAELQRGYKLHDFVLRPALVKIARAPLTGATADTPEQNDTTSSE